MGKKTDEHNDMNWIKRAQNTEDTPLTLQHYLFCFISTVHERFTMKLSEEWIQKSGGRSQYND